MILKNSKMVCLTAIVGALATGCTVTVAPPVVDVAPPVAVVEVGVPDAYVWDGVEYVGFIGGNYMYLGPGGGWLVCDSVRLERFHGYERVHPEWRKTAVRNVGPNARGRAPAHRAERREEEHR
jgi:hypothetical protein